MTRTASPTEGLLSIADISRHFSLPESTTRYYCKRFAAFIPSVGEGRRRRYRPETLEVIAAILEQMQKSRTAASVENALLVRFPRNALAVSKPEPCERSRLLRNFCPRRPCSCWNAKHWPWRVLPNLSIWLLNACRSPA